MVLTMPPRDTHPEAHQVQIAAYRAMTTAEKGAMAAQMSVLIRRLARAGIRFRHPEYSDTEVSKALTTILYGKELARRIWH